MNIGPQLYLLKTRWTLGIIDTLLMSRLPKASTSLGNGWICVTQPPHLKLGVLFCSCRGPTVAERLAISPPTNANQVQSPAGVNRAGRCHLSAGFLGDLPFPPPFQSGAAPYSPQSPSSALKTSLLKSRPNLFTHSSFCTFLSSHHTKFRPPLTCHKIVRRQPDIRRHPVNFGCFPAPDLLLDTPAFWSGKVVRGVRYDLTTALPKMLVCDSSRSRGGVAARLPASHLGEPGSIPGGVAPGFGCRNRAGRCRWLPRILGDLPFPPPAPYSPLSAHKTSMPPKSLHSTTIHSTAVEYRSGHSPI
ncbi:hypothetical protein PR048_025304 [Dryococelus australis]|uniref:Uncharacterized protein n=1 Tax=Dryococelus australis TaxID=614101 RepID=A0ABQ9GR16_9NEOP|nr:hypothetical protein PR048_025304 [Dryococelus australis]